MKIDEKMLKLDIESCATPTHNFDRQRGEAKASRASGAWVITTKNSTWNVEDVVERYCEKMDLIEDVEWKKVHHAVLKMIFVNEEITYVNNVDIMALQNVDIWLMLH